MDYDDYKHDMEELAERGSEVISTLREQVKERDRAILWLIRAAGGSISVPTHVMADIQDGRLEVEEDKGNDCRVFRYRPL